MLLAALALTMTALPLAAQEEPTGALPASEAEDFIGSWVIRIASPQGEFDADLVIRSEGGKVVASVALGPLGDHEVEDIVQTEDGIELRFEADFAGQSFAVTMPLRRDGEGLAGSLQESNGLFALDFTGLTLAKAEELELAGERQRQTAAGGGGLGGRGSERTQLTLDGKDVSIRFDPAKQDERAFGKITSIGDGEVLLFELHQSTKLRTDLDLRFGDTLVVKENVAENYPGVYSLWLQKAGDGWNLLFNDKADVWGTQHDSEADSATVPLLFSTQAAEPVETLTVELAEADQGGTLRIAWGPYEWTTAFTVAD